MTFDQTRVSTESQSVTLSLFGLVIQVSSVIPAVLDHLRFDFDFYEVSSTTHSSKNTLDVIIDTIPEALERFQHEHSRGNGWVQYRNKELILIDYDHGKVGCIFKQGFKDSVHFFGTDADFLYEKLYLFIMSRLGEHLESNSLSRIHGFALSTKSGAGFIGLAPSGGGKSTLISKLLEKYEDLKLYSDDMPILTKDLNIMPFKHRVSMIERANNISPHLLRTFIRANRPNKAVISWKAYEHRWAKDSAPLKGVICLQFTKSPIPEIESISKLKIFKLLLRDMVIGYGLPQVVEFFLVNGIKTALQKTPQFFARLIQALKITQNATGCILWQSTDVAANAELLRSWIDSLDTSKGAT